MESKPYLLNTLLERVEAFSQTSLEMIRLKSVDKSADVGSTLITHFLIASVLTVFAVTLNIALAFWLGNLLGHIHYGFFLVATFYGVIGIVLLLMRPSIKARINNSVIRQMLK